MRKALLSPPIGPRTSQPYPMSAPLKGWNARDGKASMKAGDAYELVNWFPGTSDVQIRSGCQDHVTEFAAPVKTLMVYANTSGREFFASTDGGIFDAETAGEVDTELTNCTNGIWSYANFNTVGGAFLIAVNGTDELKLYNGTTWADIDGSSTPAITGVTTSDLETVSVFKRRLWFTEKASMSLWYLDVNSIAGAATEFPVGQLFTLGGYVVAATNWTIDGGEGVDDYFAFITSEGEVAVYKGTDPSDADAFALHGVYFAGRPIGNRCFTKYGGDVVVLTETGLITLSKLLTGTKEVTNQETVLTSRIDGAFAGAVRYYKDLFGWCCVVHPLQNALIVNIPTTASTSVQFVMNTLTGAWCRFSGWPALNFTVFGDDLYFSANTKVVKAWTGPSDFGNDITAVCQQAYSYLGARGVLKQVKLVRPILEFDYSIRLELGVDVDFDDRTTYNEVLIQRGSTSLWDAGIWDTAVWASSTIIEDNWRMVDSKVGYAIALRMRVKTKTSQVAWSATDMIFERGGIF
jgi:hypothetical protein